MPSKTHLTLIQFVLEHAESEPVSRRVTVYRALADIIGDSEEAAELEGIVKDLERAEERSGQFLFNFSQKHSLSSGPIGNS